MKKYITLAAIFFSQLSQADAYDSMLTHFERQFNARVNQVSLEDVKGREFRCLLVSAVPGQKLRGSFTMKITDYLGFDQVEFVFNSGSSITDFINPEEEKFRVSLDAAPNFDLHNGIEILMKGSEGQSDYFQEWSVAGEEFLEFSNEFAQQSFFMASSILRPSLTLGDKYVLYFAKCG